MSGPTSESAGGNRPHFQQQQLLGAAKLLREWVAAQQATWPGRAPTAYPAPPVPAPAPSPVPASVAGAAPATTPSAAPVRIEAVAAPGAAPVEQAVPAIAVAADAPVSAVSAARPLFASIAVAVPSEESIGHEVRTSLRWGLRVLAAAACLAAVAIGGMKGFAAWGAWRAAPASGAVVIESDPPGSPVRVDGTEIGTTPLTANLTPGRHRIEFRRRSESRAVTVDVAAGRSTTARFDWSLANTGRLRVSSEPPGATVLVDGRERGVTPLTVDAIPVGSHVVVIQSERGSVRREVTIDEQNVAVVSEAIYSGWIHVSSPIELRVTEGATSVTLDERNQALLSPGPHDLRFENPALGFSTVRHVDVSPGATTRISVDPPRSRVTITASEDAEVVIDGERAGNTPLVNYPVAIGTREVTVRSGLAQRHFALTVTAAPARLNVDFSRP